MFRRAAHKDMPGQVQGLIVNEDNFSKRLQIKTKFGSTSLRIFFTFFSTFWNVGVWSVLLTDPKAPLWLYFTHVPVGIVTAYLTLCYWLNSRLLAATRDKIDITNGPMPWPGNKSIKVPDITGFTTRKYVAYHQNDSPVYQYKVIAVYKNFHSVDVFRGLFNRQQALKVEQLLENLYRIEDDEAQDDPTLKTA